MMGKVFAVADFLHLSFLEDVLKFSKFSSSLGEFSLTFYYYSIEDFQQKLQELRLDSNLEQVVI